MTVLITRPSPEGERLSSQLNQAGVKAICQPLLHTLSGHGLGSLPATLQQLVTGDMVIAISTASVTFADDYLSHHAVNWPKNVHYMAVGNKTATALACASGQQVIQPDARYDSEGLLALPHLQSINGKQIVILRGNGGRELLYNKLTQRKAKVSYCETYQRQWLNLNGEKLCQRWQEQHVSAIVITSGEQLIRLQQLTPQHSLAWLHRCHLLVPSLRIEKQARQLGFSQVSSTRSAANSALFDTLCQYKHDGIIG